MSAFGNVTTETETEMEAHALTTDKRKTGRPKESRNRRMAPVESSATSMHTGGKGIPFTEAERINKDAKSMWKRISEYWEMELKIGPQTR